MDHIKHFFYDKLITNGMSNYWAELINLLILLVLLIVIILLTDFIARKLLLQAFNEFAKKSKTNFDDLLVKHKTPNNIAHILPLTLTIWLFPIIFSDFPSVEKPIIIILKCYGILLTILIIRSVLFTFKSYFKTIPRLRDKPIHSYIQVVMLFVWAIGIALMFVVITNVELIKFFTALGAASAVLLLIFKDTILGFVASIQIAINDMVRIGDWITMEKYGADGEVIEINLATIQIQNFDYTITNVPTYAVLSDSFKNWRGMQQSGGRRIKRSILIKSNSVHYLTNQQITELKKIELITGYLEQKQEDITNYNNTHRADKSVLINGRNMTNLGVFRKYLQTYIERHSAINKDMLMLVRQLDPTPHGLPLEIYAFSTDKRWQNYEYIIADIFDHAIAAVTFFDLEIFESTTDNLKLFNKS